jgi:hypothetical protein
MVHVQTVNYTSPTYHEGYVKEVSRWKYPVIGKIRKGWYRPYHAQVFVDDFRVPSMCQDQFINDIGARDLGQFTKRSEFSNRIVSIGVKLFRWIGPWENKQVPVLKPMYKKEGWRYNLLLGVVKDPIQQCKMDGKYKEVL